MGSFYITLPSNSSVDHFPDNNPSHFFTKLPQTIDLNGNYEVGLSEIQFPNSYFNVLEDEVWFQFDTLHEYDEENNKLFAKKTKVKIPSGLYESSYYFIDQLNKLTRAKGIEEGDGSSPKAKFYYHRATKKVSIKVFKHLTMLELSPGLQRILGIHRQLLNGPGQFEASEMVDLDRDMKNVYVYCDLVSPRPVGDVMAPLLRTVPTTAEKTRDTMFRIYEKPHYLPLSRFHFDTLEILLTADTGKKVPFTSGKSVVTLHFRHARTQLI